MNKYGSFETLWKTDAKLWFNQNQVKVKASHQRAFGGGFTYKLDIFLPKKTQFDWFL